MNRPPLASFEGQATPKGLDAFVGTPNIDQSMASLAHSQQLADITAKAEASKKAALQANSTQGIVSETAKGTLGTLADTGVKFLRSAIQAPADIYKSLTGGGVDTSTAPSFSGTPQQTFQGEFQSKTLPAVESGQQSPLEATARTVGGVVGGGLDVLGGASSAESFIKNAPKAAEAVSNATSNAVKKTGLTDFFANRKAQKATDAALKNITPNTRDLTPTEYDELLNKGRLLPKTATSPAKIIPNENDKRLATTYKEFIQSKDPVKNTNSILEGLANKDAEVGTYLKSHNAIYNTGELRNYLLKKVEPITDIYAPDINRLNKMKADTVEGIINDLSKNDLESLWQDRKRFDRMINDKINAFGGSQTLKKEIAVAIRNGVQDFIKDGTKDTFYADKMKEMSDLYDVRDLVNTTALKEKGQNALKVWAKNNPKKAKALGWATTFAAGAGAVEAFNNLND